MVILWLLNLPTCLQRKIRNSSSCVSKHVTFTGGKKGPRKFSCRTGSAARHLKISRPWTVVVIGRSCLPKICTIMHAAAEVKIIQTEARVEGIYSVLFGMIPNNYSSLKLSQLLPRISEQRGGKTVF